MEEEYVKPAEAAKIKGVTRAAISLGISRGKLRTKEVDGKLLVCLADIVEKKTKAEKFAEEAKEADLTAKTTERTDIVYEQHQSELVPVKEKVRNHYPVNWDKKVYPIYKDKDKKTFI